MVERQEEHSEYWFADDGNLTELGEIDAAVTAATCTISCCWKLRVVWHADTDFNYVVIETSR